MKKIIIAVSGLDESVIDFLRSVPGWLLVVATDIELCQGIRQHGVNCAASRVKMGRMFFEPDDIILADPGNIHPEIAAACAGVIAIDPSDYPAIAEELRESNQAEKLDELKARVTPATRERLRAKLVSSLTAGSAGAK